MVVVNQSWTQGYCDRTWYQRGAVEYIYVITTAQFTMYLVPGTKVRSLFVWFLSILKGLTLPILPIIFLTSLAQLSDINQTGDKQTQWL